jgi:hypothetical protein
MRWVLMAVAVVAIALVAVLLAPLTSTVLTPGNPRMEHPTAGSPPPYDTTAVSLVDGAAVLGVIVALLARI